MTNTEKISDFLTRYNCLNCKACEEVCTIYKVLGKYPPQEKLEVAAQLLESDTKPEKWETVFFCTKCEACEEFCPQHISISKIIDESRNIIVKKWGIQYPRQSKLINNIFIHGNPFGKTEFRFDWVEDYPKESKNLLHLGCMLSFPLRNIGKSLINVLNKLKIDYTISQDEWCCGYFVFNTGDHESARKIIENNKKLFEQYDQIITACAGCYTFIKQKYGMKVPVRHVIELIDEKLNKDEIDLSKLTERDVVFHDSCHLARPYGLVEEPRSVMQKMGLDLHEFDFTKKKTICCGADGGMRIINPEFAKTIAKYRLEKAKEKANTLLTLCPFCLHNFRECSEKYGIEITIGDLFKELEKILD